jgi:hypothetical protein
MGRVLMAPPVLLVHLYSAKALKLILPLLAGTERPAGTVFVGHYGINLGEARSIKREGAGALYAPTYLLDPADKLRNARPVVVPNDLHPNFAGKLPSPASQFPSPAAKNRLPRERQREWGLELGRRFRDRWRTQSNTLETQSEQLPEDQRPTISSWQLDEIASECNALTAEGRAYRQFIGGVIRGIAEGRKELGDEVVQGFVWMAGLALNPPRLVDLSVTNEDVRQFWEDVDFGAKFLVGEEYPDFVKGGAVQAGTDCASTQKRLAAHKSDQCKALAGRYIVGMTPGWKRGGSLHGNPGNKLSVKEVEEWRHAFIKSRAKAIRPAGFGQFSFDGTNVEVAKALRPERVEEAIRALHFAADQVGAGA